jgi:3-phenylpropionate/cinnamic acid dioxygenase small subunit
MTEEDGIRRTLAEYCQLLDDGRFDDWAEVFAADATFMPLGNVVTGREAIRAWAYETFPDLDRIGRHLTINPIVDVDGETAVAKSDVLMLRPSPEGPRPVLVGEYHDRLVREGGRWRFARREVVVRLQEWLAPELGATATGPARP